MPKNNYTELAKAKIQPTRNVVISQNADGETYTMAQQANLVEGTRTIPIYMKGAFFIDSIEGLYNLRDAINDAIEIVERVNSKK